MNDTYLNFGDAINAITQAAEYSPQGEEAVEINIAEPHTMMPDPEGAARMIRCYEVGCYAVIGYVAAWQMVDRSILYTISV